VSITQQEAWTARGEHLRVPRFIREVVEGVAFAARRDRKIDRKSGVSQRLPITALENTLSNAERRALQHGETPVVPRIADVYAALPALTGKFELEYEGELVGAEHVARDLIREAVGETFSLYMGSVDLRATVAFFEGGATLKLRDDDPAAELLPHLKKIPGLFEQIALLGVGPDDPAPVWVSAGEFVLEGLYAQKKVGRSDDRGFAAPERRQEMELDLEKLERLRRMKKQVN
jgi:magnesium chelatase subunit I